MHARGLSADGRELYLELVEHTKRLVELGVYVWHMGAEGVLVGAAIVALDTVKGLFERTLDRAAVTQVLCELLLNGLDLLFECCCAPGCRRKDVIERSDV